MKIYPFPAENTLAFWHTTLWKMNLPSQEWKAKLLMHEQGMMHCVLHLYHFSQIVIINSPLPSSIQISKIKLKNL